MGEKVSVALEAPGQWVVRGARGEIVMALPTRERAIGFASEGLARSGGGELRVVESPGGAASILRVAPRLDQPSQGEAGSVHHAQEDEPADERLEAAEKSGEKIAAAVDKLLGRSEPADPLGKIKDLKVADLVSARVKNNEDFTIVNKGVAVGAFGLTVIALLGDGTVSAVLAAGVKASQGGATVGSYVSFGEAFFLTIVLSISAAIFAHMVLAGQMRSWGALFGWMVVTVIAGAGLRSAGLDGPRVEDMVGAVAAAHGDPVSQALGLVGEFARYYTVLPFLGGLVTGGATGWIIFRINHR